MKNRITSNVQPTSKAVAGNSQTDSFIVSGAHGSHYTRKSTKLLPDESLKHRQSAALKLLLGTSQRRAQRLYADWRVGATELEKRAYKQTDSVLLTFDDYGTPAQINAILAILEAEGVRGVFFLQGDWARWRGQLVSKIRRSGHIIGNHTYSHPDLLKLSDDAIRSEIARGPKSTWFRPPRGRYNERVRRLATEMGYAINYWSIDSEDWKGVSVEYMSQKILRELHPGAVILFHIHGLNTIKLLPDLIADIRRSGYELCSVDEADWQPEF